MEQAPADARPDHRRGRRRRRHGQGEGQRPDGSPRRARISDEAMKLERPGDARRPDRGGGQPGASRRSAQLVAEETAKMAAGLGLPPGMNLPGAGCRASATGSSGRATGGRRGTEPQGAIAPADRRSWASCPGIGPKIGGAADALPAGRRPRTRCSPWPTPCGTIKDKVRPCRQCFNLTEGELCPICADPRRDAGDDLRGRDSRATWPSLERAGTYRGLYHVLQRPARPAGQHRARSS